MWLDYTKIALKKLKIADNNILRLFMNLPWRNSASEMFAIYGNVPINTSKCDSGILEVSISDHYAIFAIDNSTHIKANAPQMTKRSFCNKNIENFRRCLNNQF